MATTPQSAPAAQRGGVQVIARAAAILRLLGDENEGLSLTQLSADAGLPRTTVHRICRALEQEGFVTADAGSGRLQLGPGLLRLASRSRRDLPGIIGPYLERLSRELNETVDLAVLDGSKVLFIAQHPAPHRGLMAVSRVGARFPSHCTANGKALLAQLPDEEIVRRLPKRLELPAKGTNVSRDGLLAELAEVRHSGLGVDREDHREGICAVGVAITALDGSICSISVPMPAARFHDDEEKVVAALLRLRDEIQGQLNGGAG